MDFVEQMQLAQNSLRGLHHATVIVNTGQEDVDFFTGAIGLRLVKQTVVMDEADVPVPVYHLYYGNENGDPGTLMTTMAAGAVGRHGQRGYGQTRAVSFSVPPGALAFWTERFERLDVPHGEVLERFGQRYVRFSHPTGFEMEMIEVAGDERAPWTTPEVSADVAVRGFHSFSLSLNDTSQLERFLSEVWFSRKTAEESDYVRYEMHDGGTSNIIDLVREPDLPMGSWDATIGIWHHVAFSVKDAATLDAFRRWAIVFGYGDNSPIYDRFYFEATYMRSPGGVLFEAATADGTLFAVDEEPADYGTRLGLPSFGEHRRAEFEQILEPITVPAHNNPEV